MPALRCSICGLDWPQNEKYKVCEGCGEHTSPVSNIQAMSRADARSLWAQLHFDRLYESRSTLEDDEFQAEIDERFTLEKWKAEAEQAKAAKLESGVKIAQRLLSSPDPVFRLRTPS